jgi:hypothetical protein
LLLLVPFLDRRAGRGEPNRPCVAIGLALMAYMLLLTWLGDVASPTK